LECVEILAPLEKGIGNNHGATALMCAAEGGYLECVKLLAPLENRMQKNDGATALMLAA